MKYRAILTIALILIVCAKTFCAEKASPRGCATFVPEFTGTNDSEKKIAIAKEYLQETKDETLKRWVYYYMLPVEFEEDKYYRMAYDLLLKEGKLEWAMNYLFTHGLQYPDISRWAMDALLELSDERIQEAFKTEVLSLSELTPKFEFYEKNPQKLREWYKVVIKALPGFGKSSEEDLTNSLKNPEPYVRLFALVMLTNQSKKQEKSLLPMLLEMTRDPDKEVSDYARRRFFSIAWSLEKDNDYEKCREWLDKIHKVLPEYDLSLVKDLIEAYRKSDTAEVKDFAFAMLCRRGSDAFQDESSLQDSKILETFFKSLLKSADREMKEKAQNVLKEMRENKKEAKESKEFFDDFDDEIKESEKLKP